MRTILHLLVAVAAFAVGAALAASYLTTLALAFLVALAFPLVFAGLVLHQGLVLGREWRPAVGKAALALLLWSIPSCPVAGFVTLLFDFAPLTLGPPPTAVGQLVGLALVAAYGAAGAGLCRWVGRYDAGGEHWLSRGGLKAL